MKNFLAVVLLLCVLQLRAQVKIGDNPNTINANSLLEMETTNKGFLPPRVALNSLTAVAPLTGTVPAGMLVYSIAGSLLDGYYYWDGEKWNSMNQANMVTKTVDATLLKSETLVLAINDITLTLPEVTAADNGLTITIKNVGTYTDQTTIVASGGASLDGIPSSKLYRWLARTFVAYNGDWIRKDKEAKTNGVFDVNVSGSWTTIAEVLEFLELHMAGPSIIRLSGETYTISETMVIDLPHAVTIEGASYGATTIEADAGLENTPMFRCLTETYFKKIVFDATSLDGYGTNSNEDAIHLEGADEYYEIKDCSFESFNKAIVAESNVELWLFETDISDAVVAGLEVNAGLTSGVKVSVSECDFTGCTKGINLSSAVDATINIVNCTFYNALITDVGVNYIPDDFTTFTAMFITNNAWNNIGAFISGFDFSLARDANAYVQNNAGIGDKNPNVYLNVTNNTTATPNLTANTTWYKILWDNAKCTSIPTKWEVINASGGIANVNRIKYLSTNKNDGYITISGNIISSSAASGVMLNIGMVKNPAGNVTSALAGAIVRYGETTLRPTAAGVPFQFSTVIYLSDIKKDDVFELWVNCSSNTTVITVQDIQMLVNSK
jgi:hypothetical protein